MQTTQPKFIRNISAAADYLAPGAIEVNKYQPEIFDLVRRRHALGQRIQQTPATGQPSRFFEQTAIPDATFTNPRVISATPDQPVRQERVVTLKALVGQINYSIFDVEVNQQQGQFAYLEAKDLTDTIDGVLKLHDRKLWDGNDTDLLVATTQQYYGISGQIFDAPQVGGVAHLRSLASTDSLVDNFKTQVAVMADREDFEVKPSAIYLNTLFADLFDQEAKTLQMYYNEVEVTPGVIVKALPTQVGLLPLVSDSGLRRVQDVVGNGYQYTAFILSEDSVEYHWLTSPIPRVFQLGLLGNLASQFVVLKFGAVVVKGPAYAHSAVYTVRA